MPRFEPFTGIRYSISDVAAVSSPPYDVFDESERDRLAAIDPHNIVLLDYPVERDGEDRYVRAATEMRRWLDNGVLLADSSPSFSIYRMTFTTEEGLTRTTTGVIGALEVVDVGSDQVLPHERTTPKAHSDRLDLFRATHSNLSPVWGLSLTPGLTAVLAEPGDFVSSCVDEVGVHHQVERVSDAARVAAIAEAVISHPVLIADGHHRYSVSREYRNERRAQGSSDADLTMTYVAELVQEQLSVAAIHRLLSVPSSAVLQALDGYYRVVDTTTVGAATLTRMESEGCICVVDADGSGVLLRADENKFRDFRALDSARLEHALGGLIEAVSYQHGVSHVLEALHSGRAESAVLIRPVSIDEIRRTANTGELMPPKSTFFTPKLRTGLVLRDLSR